MTIVFQVGSVDISGGTYVIFEHASRIKKLGHDVYILTEKKVIENDIAWHLDAHMLEYIIYEEIEDYRFDIAISTWWKTIFSLHSIKSNHYIYFVQSIESRFYPQSEKALQQLVESTYALNLPIITEATWIKEYLEDFYYSNVSLVHNGIRKDLYNMDITPIMQRELSKLRILVEGPLGIDFKNVENTIKICLQSKADEIWLLTSSDIVTHNGIDRVFSRIPINEVGKIYASCDLIVKLSYVEGMFGPPLEMFHCGGTAIVYDVSGHDEYIKHNVNGLVVKKDDEKQVIRYINLLKDDNTLLDTLKKGALKTANTWIDWDQSSKIFYQVLEKMNKSDLGQIDKNYLGMLTSFFEKQYILAEEYKLISTNSKIKSSIKNMIHFIKKIKY